MQKSYALFNLREAKDSINDLIEEMESDPEYDIGNYIVDMQHVYWHINAAWNGRDFDISSQELTDEKHDAFIQFPLDLEM